MKSEEIYTKAVPYFEIAKDILGSAFQVTLEAFDHDQSYAIGIRNKELGIRQGWMICQVDTHAVHPPVFVNFEVFKSGLTEWRDKLLTAVSA